MRLSALRFLMFFYEMFALGRRLPACRAEFRDLQERGLYHAELVIPAAELARK